MIFLYYLFPLPYHILFKTVFKGIKNNEKLELKHKEISQDKTIKK
ncbi:hypothetical protein CNEO_530060 [Clostridium neonatale]|nr:hypothetical protein CNEO_530060 [Clostridium neonatale]